jgi:uncharacterized protein YndB with AHSA1/START domain
MRNSGNLQVISPSDREIAMIRVFDAPRQRVLDALIKPELLKQWFNGPPGWSLVVCEMDLKVGGVYRYVWRGPDGSEMGMGGVYQEVALPDRIVATESFDEPWYPGKAVATMLLAEQDGKTTITNKVRYSSRKARDAVLKTPMEHGVAMGYDLLEKLLTATAAAEEPDAG